MDSNSDLAGQGWGGLTNEVDNMEGEPRTPVSQPGPALSGGHLWARRLGLLVFVLICLELGIALVVLPWTRIWTENNLLLSYPTIRFWAANTFVRGAFSGLGLIDIWLGIWQVVSYRENRTS